MGGWGKMVGERGGGVLGGGWDGGGEMGVVRWVGCAGVIPV